MLLKLTNLNENVNINKLPIENNFKKLNYK